MPLTYSYGRGGGLRSSESSSSSGSPGGFTGNFLGTVFKALFGIALVAFLFGGPGLALLYLFLKSFPLWLVAILILAGLIVWRRA